MESCATSAESTAAREVPSRNTSRERIWLPTTTTRHAFMEALGHLLPTHGTTRFLPMQAKLSSRTSWFAALSATQVHAVPHEAHGQPYDYRDSAPFTQRRHQKPVSHSVFKVHMNSRHLPTLFCLISLLFVCGCDKAKSLDSGLKEATKKLQSDLNTSLTPEETEEMLKPLYGRFGAEECKSIRYAVSAAYVIRNDATNLSYPYSSRLQIYAVVEPLTHCVRLPADEEGVRANSSLNWSMPSVGAVNKALKEALAEDALTREYVRTIQEMFSK